MDELSAKKTIELTADLELMLSCAMRYCMGRRTYIVGSFCSYVESILPDLSIVELEHMQKDFDNHSLDVGTGYTTWGDDCDRNEWMSFKKKLDLEIAARSKKI